MGIDVIASWATWMRAGGTAPGTIELRTRHVRKVLRDIPMGWGEISAHDLIGFFADQRWSPNTRRSYRASLVLFFGWLYAGGLRSDNPAGLVPRVRVPRGRPRPTPETIYREALTEADERVRLMLELGGVCGLRRGEISRVRREDVFEDLVGHSLRVDGKGGHVRHVPLTRLLAQQLLEAPPGWLFPSPTRPGPMTPAHVGKLVSRALPDGWTCHTLRHRCATVGFWNTNDILAVQQVLGHLSLDTTQIYVQATRGGARAAVESAA